MFTSSSAKFANALSKALAARSAAEMAAAAATMTAIATAMASGDNNNAASQQKSSSEKPMHQYTQTSTSTSSSHPSHLFASLLPQGTHTTTTTSCDNGNGTFLEPPPEPSSSSSVKKSSTNSRFKRLARRKMTIQKMHSTSTRNATLEERYDVDLDHPLGEGAFGAVYTAHHRVTNEKVAVKKIPKQFTSDMNFQREMEALLHIRAAGGHPNICGLRENFDQGNFYYLVLDLVSGGEMFDHLCLQGAYSEADAARLVREVASALAFCHGIGLVHGDLVRCCL